MLTHPVGIWSVGWMRAIHTPIPLSKDKPDWALAGEQHDSLSTHTLYITLCRNQTGKSNLHTWKSHITLSQQDVYQLREYFACVPAVKWG